MGTVSYFKIDVDLLPNINLPYAVIATTYPGASPEEVEEIVTRPIEKAISSTSNIKNIKSISSENSSLVICEFYAAANMDSVTIEMNEKLDMIQPIWDEKNITSPIIIKLNPDMLPIMVSAVDVEGLTGTELTQFVTDKVLPPLESVEGVGSIETSGLIQEKINVDINQQKIDQINDDILAKIDGQLALASSQLTGAQAALNNQKSALANEMAKQTAALDEGKSALTAARQDLISQQQSLNTALQIAQISAGTLAQALEEMDRQEAALTAEREKIIADGEEIAQADRLAQIETLLAAISTARPQALAQLTTLQTQIAQSQEALQQINGGLGQLDSKQAQIDAGLNTLAQQKTLAEQKLAAAQNEITAGKQSLQSAKAQAYASANLGSMITADMVSSYLMAQNFSMPAGYIHSADNQSYLVKVGDKIKTFEELQNLVLFKPNIDSAQDVRLKDVADIAFTDNAQAIYAKINGRDGVLLVFQKQSMYSTSDVANRINEKMNQLQTENSAIHITNLMDQGDYIKIIVDAILNNLLMGAVLAVLVLMLFLRSMRTTAIIAISIPISVIFALSMMYFTGITFNIISLAGLALGIGMLVDNSIVVIENIFRLRSEGMGIKEAALKGSRQVAGAITASTITTICVFLPIVFTQGLSKELFSDMGLTIAFSLIASLIVALSLVPAMASTMLKAEPQNAQRNYEKVQDFYERLLSAALQRKAVVLVASLVLLLGSAYGVSRIGTAFIPKADTPQMSATMHLNAKQPSFETLKAMSDDVTQRMMQIEEVRAVGALQLNDFESAGSDNTTMTFYIVLDEKKKKTNEEIKAELLEKTKDLDCTINVTTSNMDVSMLGGEGLEVIVKGRELDVLQKITQDMAEAMRGMEGTVEVSDGMSRPVNEIRVLVNKDRAAQFNLTVAQIYATLSNQLRSEKEATSVVLDNKIYSVTVSQRDKTDMTGEEIGGVEIAAPTGEKTDIAAVAQIDRAQGPQSVYHENQQRYMVAGANIDDKHNIGLIAADFQKIIDAYDVPEGYSIEIQGENKIIQDTMRDLALMLALAIIFIYLIMVAQFQSLLLPFIVMFTIPLAFTGGLLALLAAHMELSVIAMLGFIILSGVIVNNGIVFIDYVNQLVAQGMPKRQALILGGKTRMRPIFMTALTTILGLVTMAMGLGMGAEVVQPMAVVTIGGLLYGTVVTLFVVPVMYEVLSKDKKKKDGQSGKARLINPQETETV